MISPKTSIILSQPSSFLNKRITSNLLKANLIEIVQPFLCYFRYHAFWAPVILSCPISLTSFTVFCLSLALSTSSLTFPYLSLPLPVTLARSLLFFPFRALIQLVRQLATKYTVKYLFIYLCYNANKDARYVRKKKIFNILNH